MNKWLLNIGYLERSILLQIGRKYEIDCLCNIDNYLIDENTILYLNEALVELSSSPFVNIKEIARKFPECFSEVYKTQLIDCDPEQFDDDFFQSLEKMAIDAVKNFKNGNFSYEFEYTNEMKINEVFESFLNFLEKDELVTKQLHYVLQVMFQTVFSSAKNSLESKYLLTSLISPRYRIDYQALQEDLIFEFRKRGGDIIKTSVKDWGIADGKLSYLLLNTIDGMVDINQTSYFGKTSELLPFENESIGTQFLSISLECYINHDFIDIFRNKRICFSGEKRMGSDFPYWEIYIDNDGLLKGVYSFADYLGTKANFYYHHALEDIFQSLQTMLPGIVKADWISKAKLGKGSDVWFEYEPGLKPILDPQDKHSFSKLFHKVDGRPLAGIEHCGPKRSKSLGLFSYLLEIIS